MILIEYEWLVFYQRLAMLCHWACKWRHLHHYFCSNLIKYSFVHSLTWVATIFLMDNKFFLCGCSFIKQILTYVECNDLYTPLKQLLNSRIHSSNATTRSPGAYRDILFLSFEHFGKDIMDHGRCMCFLSVHLMLHMLVNQRVQ